MHVASNRPPPPGWAYAPGEGLRCCVGGLFPRPHPWRADRGTYAMPIAVKHLPSPLMGEGLGGGAHRRSRAAQLLPPIPTFPHQGGRRTMTPWRIECRTLLPFSRQGEAERGSCSAGIDSLTWFLCRGGGKGYLLPLSAPSVWVRCMCAIISHPRTVEGARLRAVAPRGSLLTVDEKLL
jgi:hypothetical protein